MLTVKALPASWGPSKVSVTLTKTLPGSEKLDHCLTLTFVTESGYQGVFSTLSIENVPVQLLKMDAASGATTISFFPPAE